MTAKDFLSQKIKKKWVLRLKNVTAAKYGSNKGNQT